MLNKIEKLREINTLIKNVLIELETKLFIENINNVKDNTNNEETSKPKFIAEIKQ